METFLSQIHDTMTLYQLMFSQLIDKAEESGFYPTDELNDLRDLKKQLLRDYDNPDADKSAIWEQLGNISAALKNPKGTEMADDLWKILADIEIFLNKYYEDAELN